MTHSANEWLDDRLLKTRGRDAMLDEAERIVALLDDRAIEMAFGRELAGRINASVKDGFLEYLEEQKGAVAMRNCLSAVVPSIEPGAIEQEWAEEMAGAEAVSSMRQ